MDQNAVHIVGFLQAHEGPSRPTINALVDATSTGVAVARISFASAHPNQIRVQAAQGDSSDALGGLVIKQWRPRDAGTFALPKPARCRAYINFLW